MGKKDETMVDTSAEDNGMQVMTPPKDGPSGKRIGILAGVGVALILVLVVVLLLVTRKPSNDDDLAALLNDIPETPVVDEEEEVDEDDTINDKTSVLIDYDYTKQSVSTLFEGSLSSENEFFSYCYRFLGGSGPLEDRVDSSGVLPSQEPRATWSYLNNFEASEAWTHVCETSDSVIVVVQEEAGAKAFFLAAAGEGIVFQGNPWVTPQSVLAVIESEDTLQLSTEFGDGGVRSWQVYSIDSYLDVVPEVRLVEECTSRDSSEENRALLECAVLSGLTVE